VVLGFGALLLLAALGLVMFGRKPLADYAQRMLVRAAKERFGGDIEFGSLTISVLPHVRISAKGLVLRMEGRTDMPPLIKIRGFQLDGNIVQMLRPAPEFESLRMDGLEIDVPPRRRGEEALRSQGQPKSPIKFTIEEVSTQDAVLNILSHTPDKPSLTFNIHDLKMKHFQSEGPAAFHATLTNPKPVGEIQTDGEFGPWDKDEPSETPVKGEFEFSNADLASLRGISGTLSSKGKYEGVLDTISVNGETQTPDFSVAVSGHVFPLNTEYDAVIDGTGGNVTLKSVQVHFLHTSLVASGTIAKEPGETERKILLDVDSESARVEDLLQIAVKSSKPLLTGSATLKTTFDLRLHRGETTISRMELAGKFGVGGAKFTSSSIQEKVDSLSKHGRGDPSSADDSPAVSKLEGEFNLKNGVIHFSQLSFEVQGAAFHLTGSYGLQDESLDFRGTLRLQAKLSQMTTGIKSALLTLIDPLFERNGAGTVVPILIGGTRTNPSFGIDLHHAKPAAK
jgi:uncharacterized protein involved in outer membrane biogenesis